MLLGGDVEFEIGQRRRTPTSGGPCGESDGVSETVRMQSMAIRDTQSVPIELKAVDDAYPLYGQLAADGRTRRFRHRCGDAWIGAALADRMGSTVGDSIRLGNGHFASAGSSPMSPTVGRGLHAGSSRRSSRWKACRAPGLIQPGSLYQTKYRVRMPDGEPGAVVAAFEQRFPEYRLGNPHARTGGTRRFALRRSARRVSDAGRPGRAGDCGHRHWRRGVELISPSAVRHRDAEGAGCDIGYRLARLSHPGRRGRARGDRRRAGRRDARHAVLVAWRADAAGVPGLRSIRCRSRCLLSTALLIAFGAATLPLVRGAEVPAAALLRGAVRVARPVAGARSAGWRWRRAA